MNFGVTSLAAPKAASSRVARIAAQQGESGSSALGTVELYGLEHV